MSERTCFLGHGSRGDSASSTANLVLQQWLGMATLGTASLDKPTEGSLHKREANAFPLERLFARAQNQLNASSVVGCKELRCVCANNIFGVRMLVYKCSYVRVRNLMIQADNTDKRNARLLEYTREHTSRW